MNVSELSNEELKQKIFSGRRWLEQHTQLQDGSTLSGEAFSDEKFDKNLKVYEFLVERYRERGLDEPDIVSDEEVKKKELQFRRFLNQTEKHQGSYTKLYHEWFMYREQGVKRGIFSMFVPSPKGDE